MRYEYILSLPERAIRSLSALSGGLLREIGEVSLPVAVRRTTLYRTMVGVTLRFLIEELGEVEDAYPASGTASEAGLAENFIVQRTASHGIELLGILAFHASPVWILAALADVSAGGHTMLREIVEALKEENLLDRNARFETMEQVLNGLEKTSEHLALTLNMPPVNMEGLRREWQKLGAELRGIPVDRIPRREHIEQVWSQLRDAAQQQNRTVFAMSSVMAVSALAHVPANLLWLSKAARSATRRATGVVGSAMLDHYAAALEDMTRTGFSGYWRREFRPYLRAAAEQFAPGHRTLTERLLRSRSV